jgi:RHS repeat-associated protein
LDNAGNRNSKADLYAGVTTNYGYDSIYELLSATLGASTTESYTYDPVGNRLSNLSGSGWSNNTSNELTSRPGVTYTYDNNGNTTSKTDSTGTTNYTWDFENRLSSVTLPGTGGTVSFAYDPFGRRIKRVSNAGTSIYAYDKNNLIEETNSSGTVVARYAQALKMDEELAMLRSGTTSYYEADGLGTATSLSNSAGALAQTYTFDSFGNLTASSGSLTNPFRFTGREWDTETNLQFSRFRYYDPTVGRFLSEDPLGFKAASNFYPYVDNSRLNTETLWDSYATAPRSKLTASINAIRGDCRGRSVAATIRRSESGAGTHIANRSAWRSTWNAKPKMRVRNCSMPALRILRRVWLLVLASA